MGRYVRATVWPSGLCFFLFAVLLTMITFLIIPTSSVSLLYFIIAVLMCKCLGKLYHMSYTFSIAEWYLIFRSLKTMKNSKLAL